MAHNIQSIADKLGAKVVGQVPDVGGGAFGATRLARVVAALCTHSSADRERLPRPGIGPGE